MTDVLDELRRAYRRELAGQDHGRAQRLGAAITEIERLQASGREAIAAWMIKHSYATGHGDTIEDLLSELEAQVSERHRAPSSW